MLEKVNELQADLLKMPDQVPTQELEDLKTHLGAVQAAFNELQQSVEADRQAQNPPGQAGAGGQAAGNRIFKMLMAALLRARRLIEVLD